MTTPAPGSTIHSKVHLWWSSDGFSMVPVSNSNPLPVTGTVTASNPSVGTVGAAVPGSATAVGWKDGSGNLQDIAAATPLPTVQTGALPAGTNVIGHVISDTGSTTAVTQATAASLNATVVTTGGVAVAKDSSLTTINTTLGSPFQAGGSIGNTTFAATQATASSLNAQVVGNTASGVAVAGNPVQTGGRAATTNPTAVADGQVVETMHDKLGKLVSICAVRVLKGSQKTTITASTSETTIVTQLASTFLDLYGLILANTGATTTKVDIRDTTGGSVIATFEVPAGDMRGFMLPADSGLAQTTVNTNWTAQCGSSTSSLEVTAMFVKNT